TETDVHGADRRADAGPERDAEDRIVERDVAARLERVAELDADAGEGREQREIADAPEVARADAHRILAADLVAVQAREVEQAAHAEHAMHGRLAADRRIVAAGRDERVPAPGLRVDGRRLDLLEIRVRAERPVARDAPLHRSERADARKRDAVDRVHGEAAEELATPEIVLRQVLRVADTQLHVAARHAHAEAILGPARQLAA